MVLFLYPKLLEKVFHFLWFYWLFNPVESGSCLSYSTATAISVVTNGLYSVRFPGHFSGSILFCCYIGILIVDCCLLETLFSLGLVTLTFFPPTSGTILFLFLFLFHWQHSLASWPADHEQWINGLLWHVCERDAKGLPGYNNQTAPIACLIWLLLKFLSLNTVSRVSYLGEHTCFIVLKTRASKD